jgi:predicted double-glycine peptidase
MKILDRLIQEVTMLDFPDSRQAASFSCGASAVQSILVYYGVDMTEVEIQKKVGTEEVFGTHIKRIKKFLDDLGFKYEEATNMTIKDIEKYIDKSIPVMIAIQAWPEDPTIDYEKDWDDGHYVVAIGYDDKNIIFDDPSVHSQRGIIPKDELLKRWHDVDEQDEGKVIHWGLAIFGRPIKYKSADKVKIESK